MKNNQNYSQEITFKKTWEQSINDEESEEISYSRIVDERKTNKLETLTILEK